MQKESERKHRISLKLCLKNFGFNFMWDFDLEENFKISKTTKD